MKKSRGKGLNGRVASYMYTVKFTGEKCAWYLGDLAKFGRIVWCTCPYGRVQASHDSATQKLQTNVATVSSQGPDLLQVWKAHYAESALV